MSARRLTLGWVARASGGVLRSGASDQDIGEVVIDSRAVTAGDFFVALKGPRFDGHAFVPEVVSRGVTGVMVEAAAAVGSERVGTVVVADTLRGLQDLARALRRESQARVIAITGSAGKTTTKEAIARLLESRFSIVKNQGNLNNHIGLPLSLMQLRSGPDVAVMELGMNHAGEISTLVEIAAPDVRVWTNVGDAHLGFFSSPDAIADAKAEVLEGARAGAVLVCNADDARVMTRVAGFAGRTLTFGIARPATVHADDVEDLGVEGMRARVRTASEECELRSPLLGRGNLANVLAATTVAVELGAPLAEIAEIVPTLQPADRRGAVHRLGHGVTVIDDSYNSSPAALKSALEVLARATTAGRRVAVLGEMLELGDHAVALHQECGRAAAAAGVEVLIAIGGEAARALAAAAVAAGLPTASVTYCEASVAAAALAIALIRPGDVVLVKGSRGTRTDLVVDGLVAGVA